MFIPNWLSHAEIRRIGVPVIAYLVVIAGLVILAVQFGPETGGKVHQDANDQRKLEKLPSVLGGFWKPKVSQYQYPCYETEDHDQADLCQQWRAANAAESTASTQWFWNLIQDALTIIAVWFAAKAAREASNATRVSTGALGEAKRSADAATVANLHQHEVSAIELRPYVFCEKFITSPSVTIAAPEEVSGWLLEIEWKNFGKTPAVRVRAHVNVEVFELGDTPEKTGFKDIQSVWPHGQTLAPGQNYYSRCGVELAGLIRAWKGEARVIYWGWVEYDGRSRGTRHRTEICAELTPQGDPTVLQTHFRNAWLTAFNATDADCVHKPKT